MPNTPMPMTRPHKELSMPARRRLPLFLAAAALILSAQVSAKDKFEGFLCCNMRTDGSWISDSNYAENGKRIIPVGTPTKVTGFGRYRVKIEIPAAGGGKPERHAIGNDYSRDLSDQAFAARYVVAQDPRLKIDKYPEKIRKAIQSARITRGMTREQVLMALGYPISSENPNLDADVWRYWLGSFEEFQVLFDKSGKVRDVTGDAQTLNRVLVR
jgi:hypothetical protein